jgi:hypothetical protein
VERGIARILIATGLALVAAGLIVLASPRIPWIGRLPGDLRFGKGNVSVYFPVATCLLLSVLLTLLVNLLRRR